MLGQVELIHGDCLEVEWPRVDAIITDVPYGTTSCKWDVVLPFDKMWAKIKGALKPKGAFVTTASQPFTSALVMSNPKWFKYEWIWKKNTQTNGMNAKKHPLNNYENILVFYISHGVYNPQMKEGKPYKITRNKPNVNSVYGKTGTKNGYTTINSGRYPNRIIEINVERGVHPTQKPVALYEYLIRTYTNEGDTVLDFTMGSGTTGVACINTGRKFVGIEKDDTYFEIAKQRIDDSLRNLP